ncbi:MAG: glycosyltransferase family 2 protein, partial [Nitrospirota bacterium]
LEAQKVCSVIIVTYNSSSCIDDCLAPLLELSDIEVVVVDNDSKDGSAAKIQEEYPKVTLIALQENIGFGRACNIGVVASGGSYVLLLNPDAVATAQAIRTLIEFCEKHPRAGIVGGRLVDRSGLPLQAMGDRPSLFRLVVDKPMAWMAKRVGSQGILRRLLGRCSTKCHLPHEAEPVAWVSGAFLCCRRAIWNEIGGFDEQFFLYYEDVDLCLRVSEAGWEVWHVPDAVVEHQSGASFAGNVNEQKRIYYANQRHFFQKHQGPLSAAFLSFVQDVYFRLSLFKQFANDRIGRL